jgi:hypothetical protein
VHCIVHDEAGARIRISRSRPDRICAPDGVVIVAAISKKRDADSAGFQDEIEPSLRPPKLPFRYSLKTWPLWGATNAKLRGNAGSQHRYNIKEHDPAALVDPTGIGSRIFKKASMGNYIKTACRILVFTIGMAHLAWSASVAAREYDAESDIGLVAKSPSAAATNTERLNAALDAQWSGGKFHFVDGHVGPILDPIRAAATEFFFQGSIKTSRRVGGALYGFGTRSWALPSSHFSPGPGAFGGAMTRFTRIDGETGGGVLRLRGNGFVVDGIQFQGRRYTVDPSYKGPQSGIKTPCGIEVEGRGPPTTSLHVIRNCGFIECTYGICARAGYYDEQEKFVRFANYADNAIVDGALFFGCDSCFRSESPQAVVWRFRDITIGSYGRAPVTLFDVVHGGDIWVDGVSLNHKYATLFKVYNYAANCQLLTCKNLKWDNAGGGPESYLTLFKYEGPTLPDYSDMKWTLRVEGHIGGSDTKPAYDASKLIQAPAGLPKADLLFDIARLPQQNFIMVGDGPWWRPK